MADIAEKIKQASHWRVLFRPTEHVPVLISSVADCLTVVERNRVQMRGWDFPHLSNKEHQREIGSNWIGCWSDFMGRMEYWRLYQSGQFLYLSGVEEMTNPDWEKQLRARYQSFYGKWEYPEPRGFISINNFLFQITEIIEFAARLMTQGIYKTNVELTIELNGIRESVLMTERDRGPLFSRYAATQDQLKRVLLLQPQELAGSAPELAIKTVVWFFERFGWLRPPVEVLVADQQKLISGTW